jgi:hypothetical protein
MTEPTHYEELYAFVGIVVALLAPSLLGMRLMLRGAIDKLLAGQRSLDERFSTMVGANDELHARVSALERLVSRVQVEISKDYVRREDWIRTSTQLTVKMDRVVETIGDLRTELRAELHARNQPTA